VVANIVIPLIMLVLEKEWGFHYEASKRIVDEGRMLQVLKNLVDNALRYTPEKGKITLSAVVGDRVQLRVSDTGAGIRPLKPSVFGALYYNGV
jgi:signal transduction histidine kinase